MLEIDDLWVNIDDKEVLKGINLRVPVGETHILFGKNGSGKSSLLMTIMGFGRYAVKQGRISFLGQDITQLPIYERARLGLACPSSARPRSGGQDRGRLAGVLPGRRHARSPGRGLRFHPVSGPGGQLRVFRG